MVDDRSKRCLLIVKLDALITLSVLAMISAIAAAWLSLERSGPWPQVPPLLHSTLSRRSAMAIRAYSLSTRSTVDPQPCSARRDLILVGCWFISGFAPRARLTR